MKRGSYMVSSTLAGVSLPWMDFMAAPARCIAKKVSWLMFADSIAFICCSMVPMWFRVCSRLCSWIFLRRSAAFAAIRGRGVSILVATSESQRVAERLSRGGVQEISIPVLFVLTFFRATCSCSSIWRVR